MSQPDYPAIIRQLQEQITALTVQIRGSMGRAVVGMKIARPPTFNGTSLKISGFVTAYKNEDEGGSSRRADLVGVNICARRISRHLKEECFGRVGRRRIGI